MRAYVAVLALLLSAAPGILQADTITVVPNGNATVEGNANNGYPFNVDFFGVTSQRYQQVYNASDFGAVSGPALITAIAFRPDAGQGNAFTSTLANVQINLSTTSSSAGSISSTFASNVGADDTIVRSGALTLSSADTPVAGGTRAFDIVINLTTPFLYDPSLGNLLLDVRNFSGGATTQFDAAFTASDSVARSFYDPASSPTGATDSIGLVTQFTFEGAVVAPLPGALAGGMVLMGLVGAKRRRRAQAKA